jgi:glycosyltransferase involved in cell wall biosynthesis
VPQRERPRILFLARRYPPSVGGVQTYAYQLREHLARHADVRLIALGRNSLAHLAWFVPWALKLSMLHILFRRPDVVYFNDGVIACLATFLKPFSRARFVVTVHALEMTYKHPVFSRLMRWGVLSCDAVVAVSRATESILQEVGIDPQRIVVIYQGIQAQVLPKERHDEVRKRFEKAHGFRLGDQPVLLNYGRQIPRKGLAPFIERGLPLLREDAIVLIGGEGTETPGHLDLVQRNALADRVRVLGLLDDDTQAMLRREADLFLMPNVHVANDAEGFGIAPLECMSVGLPVVAFKVDALGESLREASYLVEPGDYGAFVDAIHRYLDLPAGEQEAAREACADYVRRNYTWDRTVRQYLDVFRASD